MVFIKLVILAFGAVTALSGPSPFNKGGRKCTTVEEMNWQTIIMIIIKKKKIRNKYDGELQ